MKTSILRIMLAAIVAGAPVAAHAGQGTITVNDVAVATTAVFEPCLVPPGSTECTVNAEFPEVTADAGQEVIILPGGSVEATAVANNLLGGSAVPGVINSIKLTGLALLYVGASTPGKVKITYGNRFPLPDAVWTTPGFGGFKCDSSTLIPSDNGNTICRNYGFTASGSFCRLDANGDCQTADGDNIGMTQSVTFESSKGGIPATENIGTGITYPVDPGGVQNNEFFPLAKVAVPDANVACNPLINGTCAAVETLDATLTFSLNTNDAIFLSASPTGIGGDNPNHVANRLKFAEIDIQPSYDPSNNDINLTSGGSRTVAVLSSKTFDPTTIKLDTAHPVLLSVGGGDGVAGIGNPTFRDLNGDGKKDAIFTFSVPALAAAGSDCAPPVAVLTGTARFTSTYQKIVGKGKNSSFQTVADTEDLQFSGSQTFTCAPKAGQ